MVWNAGMSDDTAVFWQEAKRSVKAEGEIENETKYAADGRAKLRRWRNAVHVTALNFGI